MDSRKLERIILLILVLLNVFLLAVVLSDSAETRRSNAETIASITELLERNGITVSPGAIRISSAPAKCTLTRDLELEQRFITGLVGSSDPVDQGGNILYYAGKKGQAQLRGSGELDVLFQSGAVPLRRGEERTALLLLRRAGVNAVASETLSHDGKRTDFYATLNGIPVYNAVLHFSYTDTDISMLTGTRVFDSVAAEDQTALLDSVSVLIRFMEIVRDEGYICSRIDAVEPGYFQSVIRSGETVLTPVWHIKTDAGAFLIDAETGKTENRFT